MAKTRKYEEEILQAVRAIPDEALPKLLQMIRVIRDQYECADKKIPDLSQTSHERTRQLLASSKTNWAREVLAERQDRL
jgi:hypothetical protein